MFNLLVIPYCIMQGKNDFVKFFIFSLVAKAFFDSATLFYPLIEREKQVSHLDVISLVVQFRIMVSFLLFLVSQVVLKQ